MLFAGEHGGGIYVVNVACGADGQSGAIALHAYVLNAAAVIGIEAVGQAQRCGQPGDAFLLRGLEGGVFFLLEARLGAAVIARDQGGAEDFVSCSSPPAASAR